MLKIWLLIVLFINLYYVVQFIAAYLAFKRLPNNFGLSKLCKQSFSIVVAMRNEEENIPFLFESLGQLDYPAEKFEVVLVDDFSNDETVAKAQKEAEKYPNLDLRIISLATQGLQHNKAFKKTAIQFGVKHSKYQWIVTTDADCSYSPKYLKTLDGFIEKHNPKFVSAPVELAPKSTLLQKMEALEFRGLVALGAAYLKRNKPFICNGANLAFQKEVFMNLNGFKGFDDTESGDDVWFMHKVQERYPYELFFALHPNLVVKTFPCPNINAFINQRKRWTAKNSSYKKVSQLLTLSIDYLFYCAIVVNLLLGMFHHKLLVLGLFMLLSKALVEINFFVAVNKRLKSKGWFFTYLITFPVQLVYVILIYPLSQFTKFNWKNRTFNA